MSKQSRIPKWLHGWYDGSGIEELADELAGGASERFYAAHDALRERLAGDKEGWDLVGQLEAAASEEMVAHEESAFIVGVRLGLRPEGLLQDLAS